MNAQEKRTTNRCNKLHELPPVVADGQQKAWRPDCDHYDCGGCDNPRRRDSDAACPFDGDVLPLREVTVETPDDQPRKPLDGGSCKVPESRARSKLLEQAIKDRIVNRTGRRMQALAIELTDRELIVRGSAPCYYVKQLALQAALDVLRCECEIVVDLKLDVDVVLSARPGLG